MLVAVAPRTLPGVILARPVSVVVPTRCVAVIVASRSVCGVRVAAKSIPAIAAVEPVSGVATANQIPAVIAEESSLSSGTIAAVAWSRYLAGGCSSAVDVAHLAKTAGNVAGSRGEVGGIVVVRVTRTPGGGRGGGLGRSSGMGIAVAAVIVADATAAAHVRSRSGGIVVAKAVNVGARACCTTRLATST